MLRYIRILNYKLCTNVIRSLATKPLSSSVEYNNEESDKILNILNNGTVNDLKRYHLSKLRAQKIDDWKSKNGRFHSIDQILELDGFGNKILEKLCTNILEDNQKSKTKSTITRFGQFTLPEVPEQFKKSCKSCVVLHIGVLSVTWVRIEVNRTSPCTLTDWEYHPMPEKKMQLHELLQRCTYLDTIIPEADCYVLEVPQTAQPGGPGNAEQVNINMQKAQTIAVLSFALMKRTTAENNDYEHNLYYLKKYLSAKLFRTLIGREQISTEETVLGILRTDFNVSDNPDEGSLNSNTSSFANEIKVPLDLRQKYNSSEGYHREFLGQSLLMGLTFVRLCLLKCSKSLTIISGKSNL